MYTPPKYLPFVGAVILAGASFLPSLQAADYSWNATANANWGTASNWRVDGTTPAAVPSSTDNIVGFNDAGTGALQIQGSRAINNITFNSTVRDVDIINATSSSDSTLTIGGTLNINSSRTLTFRGSSSSLLSLSVANITLSGGAVRFGSSATQYLQAFSSTGSALVTGGTASFILANSGTATFNDLTVNGGVINIVGTTSGTGGLSATSLSGTGGVIQTQSSSGSSLGHLIVAGSGTSTYGGTIANGGSGNTLDFTKTGTGVQILTGTNTFTGGTTISGGVLQLGDGGTSGSLAGAIVNNAQLSFNRSDVAIHSNVISGTGSVSQIGAGTTVLTGANTYTGLTTISSGTLQVGNGGSLGSITGDVSLDNGGAFVVARTGSFTYGGVISGSNGTVTKQNSGTWTLTAASTFSGTTEVAPGTPNNNITLGHANALQNSTVNVRVADGLRFSTTSSTYTVGTLIGSGNIALNDTASSAVTLRVGNNNSNLPNSYTGVLSGLGGLEKIGTGAQRLTGSNTYSGGTVIRGGTLLVNNTTGSGVGVGAVTVNSGATLGGLGYVALGSANAITVESGGRIAAGTANIGTLTFDFGGTTGGLSMLDGSSFVFKLGATNTSDSVRFYNFTDGDLVLGSNVNLSISNAQLGTFDLFAFYSDAGTSAYTGDVNLSNLSISGLGGYSYSLDYSNGIVSLQVVPEPQTYALLAGAAAAAAIFFRRKGARKAA